MEILWRFYWVNKGFIDLNFGELERIRKGVFVRVMGIIRSGNLWIFIGFWGILYKERSF